MATEAKTTHDWTTMEIGDVMAPTDEGHDGHVSVCDSTDAELDIEIARFVFDLHGDIPKSEAFANARLFIAAGKLLQAAKTAEMWMEAVARGRQHKLDQETAAWALAGLREAIAAATKTEE